MSIVDDILNKATQIIRTELPNHLSADFVVSDVQANSLPGPDEEDYIHVNVILADGHPELEVRKVLEFNEAIRPKCELAGVTPIPTISYSKASEFNG